MTTYIPYKITNQRGLKRPLSLPTSSYLVYKVEREIEAIDLARERLKAYDFIIFNNMIVSY